MSQPASLADVARADYEEAIRFLKNAGGMRDAFKGATAVAEATDRNSAERRRAFRAAHILRRLPLPVGEPPDSALACLRDCLGKIAAGQAHDDGMRWVFVETTVQWDKIIGSAGQRPAIRDKLWDRRTASSCYCLEELDRSLGNYFRVFLYHVREAADWQELYHKVYSSRFLPASFPRRCHVVLAAVEEENKQQEILGGPLSSEQRLAVAADIAAIYLMRKITSRFMEGIDCVFKSFDVPVSPEESLSLPEPGCKDPVLSCNEKTARCAIGGFFEQRADEFRRIHAGLKQIPEQDRDRETSQRLEKLDQIFPNTGNPHFNRARGSRRCNALSDAVLAVECPPEAAMCTTDLQHMEPICSAIGRLPPQQP